MSENKSYCHSGNTEMVCIDCNRILDSCRDKDCFENVRVFLTEFGQQIIEKTSSVKVKSTKVVWSCLDLEGVPFNRGFYQINVKFYTKIIFEACVGGGRTQEFEGIAVTEKKIILYGSEGNVNIFRSEAGKPCFCDTPTYGEGGSSNSPTVVCEVTDPIALSVKVVRDDKYCCCPHDLPKCVCDCLSECLCDDTDEGKKLYVTLGFFSVVRIERPCQYMIKASEYTIPDKVCVEASDDDPCAAFAKMSFPVNEFYPPSFSDNNGGCGCK